MINKLRVSFHTELQLYTYAKKKRLNKLRGHLHTEMKLYMYITKRINDK